MTGAPYPVLCKHVKITKISPNFYNFSLLCSVTDRHVNSESKHASQLVQRCIKLHSNLRTQGRVWKQCYSPVNGEVLIQYKTCAKKQLKEVNTLSRLKRILNNSISS